MKTIIYLLKVSCVLFFCIPIQTIEYKITPCNFRVHRLTDNDVQDILRQELDENRLYNAVIIKNNLQYYAMSQTTAQKIIKKINITDRSVSITPCDKEKS